MPSGFDAASNLVDTLPTWNQYAVATRLRQGSDHQTAASFGRHVAPDGMHFEQQAASSAAAAEDHRRSPGEGRRPGMSHTVEPGRRTAASAPLFQLSAEAGQY